MSTEREDMIAEATDLGIEFKGNISNVKLAAKLAEFKGEPEPLQESAPSGPAVKEEAPLEEQEDTMSAVEIVRKRQREVFARKRKMIADAKAKAMKTKVVTLTNKDARENDVVTTAYLSVQNQYFAVARNVPLDMPVELEVCLINLAENAMITMHRDEIDSNGRRTGNKVTARVKKYAVSYSPIDPS